MNPKHREIIEKAAMAVTDKNWCRRYWAVNENKESIKYNDEKACQWCAEGYILKAAHDLGYGITIGAEAIDIVDSYAIQYLDCNGIIHFNDKKAKSPRDIREMFLGTLQVPL